MTNKTMLLTVVSAEGEIFSGQVSSLIISGQAGDVGIHPGHTALITPIKPGQIMAKDDQGNDWVLYISGGILEVQPTVVTVLADTALHAKDLDEAAAERAKQKAQDVLNQNKTDIDYALANAELVQALAQLRAIQAIRKNLKH
jgi:F-type H+-transporting ATPase subunit epsilon